MWRSVVGAHILECDGLTSLSRTRRTLSAGQNRVQRFADDPQPALRKCALALMGQRLVVDGDKSPAESAAKSAHSKASGRDRHLLSHWVWTGALTELCMSDKFEK